MSGSWIFALAAVVVAWLVAFAPRWAPPGRDEFFGKRTKRAGNPWPWGLLLFAVMVLGILARYYWELPGRGGKLGDIDLAQMIRPLLVSPLVFFPVWSQASGQPQTLATLLIAFQNGFF